MPREGSRGGRLRSHEACLNCRRKKTRCPAEKPACSSCVRLNQACSYTAIQRGSRGGPSADRLAYLEEKVNLILNGQQNQGFNEIPERARAYSVVSGLSSGERACSNDPFLLGIGLEDSKTNPESCLLHAIELYFQYCHRQPIWCFDREEVKDANTTSEELACSIITLTSRFSQDRDDLQHYGDTARTLVMLRIANGTVELDTIESLCLLSYSAFLDGNGHVGRFHLGLALQLCRSAMLDLESSYGIDCAAPERKKRIFWSLQTLEQAYGQINGILSVPSGVLRSFYVSNVKDQNFTTAGNPPPLPYDELGCTSSSDMGIWNLALHFGWVWTRIRTFVSDCAQNKLQEPWRHDSMYAMVLSDLTELENKLSPCHRYDSVKFYERRAEEVRGNRDYWASWLKLQFTYHTILTVLNHPFLYIVASQDNENLTIPNTFWRRSSELVLLHATWIVRMIDMVTEKKMRLIDPFFGHAAAIAATVHLYYCCAADPRLKYKSKIDFAKCRKFLKSFVPFSPACEALDQTLDRMTQVASGSEKIDFDWEPSKIHLSIPLMWDLLQVNCSPSSYENATGGLLHSSLTPVAIPEEMENSTTTLEIIVAMSPEVTVNTADGGSAAHVPPKPRCRPLATSLPASPASTAEDLVEKLVAPADSLMANTPWLWADHSQYVDLENLGFAEPESTLGNVEGFSTWWDFGNL
ncbi:hypothetical protein N7495_006701 [Penicillium taxi]|uniref:uncharacterized protein n=1 Tax=Penicillium taxi TaxID=168475 RepID=UPI00254528DD|nr:uncharacterized protein N7495_006701 [Penicillium taxi]KAJ5895010.1 hypothetical protein N7495_006701 [Penicillium taxi]